MRTIEIVEYNAFTTRPFEGNPAGVVTDASDLDEALMQRIARHLNLSETAFLVPPHRGDADVRIRWFTPTREVDLCGHATIAAFTAAADQGLFGIEPGEERELHVETASGLLRVRIDRRGGRSTVAMQLPVPVFQPLEIDHDAFARLWGMTEADVGPDNWLCSEIDYWFVPVKDRKTLAGLRPDVALLEGITSTAAFAFYTPETVEPESDWHLRFFAPFHGVLEDPVTGSAQGPMGVIHLLRHVDDPKDGTFEFRGEQGDEIDRAGRVEVRVRREAGEVVDLEIGGAAVAMLEGRFRL